MKNKRSLWVSLFSVIAIAAIALGATLAAGWSPELGLDLDGGLAVVYQTHRPVSQAQLDTIVTILNDRVNAGTSGATVDSQGKNQISVSIPGEKNTQQVLATLGNTAQLFFRPALCYAPALTLAKGKTAVDRPASPPALPATAADRGQPPGHAGLEQHQRLHQQRPTSADTPFAPYKSTPPLNDNKNATVLLPGSAATGATAAACWARPA